MEMDYANGDIQQGCWQEGERNEDQYDGEFVNGQKHEYGVLKMVSGNIYQGEQKQVRKNGKGLIRFANHDIYDDHFADQLRQGYRRYYRNYHSYYEVIWIKIE